MWLLLCQMVTVHRQGRTFVAIMLLQMQVLPQVSLCCDMAHFGLCSHCRCCCPSVVGFADLQATEGEAGSDCAEVTPAAHQTALTHGEGKALHHKAATGSRLQTRRHVAEHIQGVLQVVVFRAKLSCAKGLHNQSGPACIASCKCSQWPFLLCSVTYIIDSASPLPTSPSGQAGGAAGATAQATEPKQGVSANLHKS